MSFILIHSMIPCTAFVFDSAGAGEWIVLMAVILIVVGPKRLPEIARKLGQTMEMFRRAADEFKHQIMTMDQPPPPANSYDPDGVPNDDVNTNYDYTQQVESVDTPPSEPIGDAPPTTSPEVTKEVV